MISLSPSRLSVLKDCPRCFWDDFVMKAPRPRGIFPSLPGGMDLVIKRYCDQYRGALPKFLENKVRGVLYPDLNRINSWRNWRSGLSYVDNALDCKVRGALDDCLLEDALIHIPFDAKTRGSEPKGDGSQYYQTQLDIYELMLVKNGYKTGGAGYLCYFWPAEMLNQTSIKVGVDDVNFNFNFRVYELKTDIERAKKILEYACEVIRGKRPPSADSCEYCNFTNKKNEIQE